jgi:predicted oxidoreductase
MRLTGDGSKEARQKGMAALDAAIDAGYNHFDHADIYATGASERLFGEFLANNRHLREQLIITSKAGIRLADERYPQRYDFSKTYLLKQVEGSLARLGIDYLDVFLLHRPDYLMDAHEVAETFHQLKTSGKVKHFGVSNFAPSQLALLQSACDMPLIINQVEINIHNINALLDGTLDQCQQLGISPIAWCPLGGVVYPAWSNTFSPSDEQRIKQTLVEQSKYYQVEPWQVILAWLLKHPAQILPIIGSTTPERIQQATTALSLAYSREHWYQLLEARNGQSVP